MNLTEGQIIVSWLVMFATFVLSCQIYRMAAEVRQNNKAIRKQQVALDHGGLKDLANDHKRRRKG